MSHDQQNTEVEDKKSDLSATSHPKSKKNENGSLFLYTLLAFSLALLVRLFVAAPYLVSGPSMEETFHDHDYLIVQKLSACVPFTEQCVVWGAPERGDIIIFHLPQNPSQTLIKRVIGLPGETISVNGTAVTITSQAHPKGLTLNEAYISPADAGGPTGETLTLGPDEYFAMGDNRHVSFDSRSWGPLPAEDIVGVVLLRLYPFTQIGLMPGVARYQ